MDIFPSGHFPGMYLSVSAVGFTTIDTKVGNSSSLSITLQQGKGELQEVVVTALGIKKEQKALGYSVTQLDAKELMKNKNTNVINSLAGKVPGVNITQYQRFAGCRSFNHSSWRNFYFRDQAKPTVICCRWNYL